MKDRVERGFFTTSEVAKLLNTTNQTIRNWIQNGRINAVRPGKLHLISKSELKRITSIPSTKKVEG